MYDLVKIRKEKKKKDHELREVEETNIYLPSLYLNGDELPEIKKWKVGEEYTLKIKVRMSSYSEEKSLEVKGGNSHASFEVMGVEPQKND